MQLSTYIRGHKELVDIKRRYLSLLAKIARQEREAAHTQRAREIWPKAKTI